MSKKHTPPAVGEVYQDRAYRQGDRQVRIVEETKDWRGRPAYLVEVVRHAFPDVVGRRTTVSADRIRTRYRKETSA